MSKREKIDGHDMEAVIEAILFVSNDPVPEEKLLEVFGDAAAQEGQAALEAVIQRYGRSHGGIVVDRAAGGLRLVSRPDLHGYLRRFFEATGSNKLSMPALETLAIVAYRQPITSPEIAELRGVNSQGVLKKLLERRLIRVAGRKEVVGKPFLYATTRDFLMHFGLRHLDELPPLEQFEEMWAGDSEAQVDAPPDLEEEVAREENEAQERDEAVAAAAAEEDDERQRLEAESAELPVDADEPEPDSDTDGDAGEAADTNEDDSDSDDAETEVEETETDGVEADDTDEDEDLNESRGDDGG